MGGKWQMKSTQTFHAARNLVRTVVPSNERNYYLRGL